jgi:dissimilatory sulfite reductase (desulfoviridin) alpha/beta subunit
LIDVNAVAEILKEEIEASGWCAHLVERTRGRILLHQKFRVALAGCPNACSEPQIRDFGVIGRMQPGRGEPDCDQCMECEAACRECAIVVEAEPHIDRDRCVDCGACVRACPAGTLVAAQTGYRVLVGGKLGRHPRLADTLLERTDEAGVRAAARAALGIMRQGEARLGEILEREGLEPLCRALPNYPGAVGPEETQ